jgi:cyanophycinase
MKFIAVFFFLIWNLCSPGSAQQSAAAKKGSLFIIGGGNRSAPLLETLVSLANLRPADYIVVLPMSSAEPDSSFFYIRKDLSPLCTNNISNLNFTSETVTKKAWLDSLRDARMIFITGGDQNRFMKIVLNTPVQAAIHAAYQRGATIAGTSAGAAVMSKQMITGSELAGDSIVSGTFRKIAYRQVEIKQGLGLIEDAIIDQHFVARSRYNRLLSVLAENPTVPCIGIDEGTALIVKGNQLTVTGASQVIRLVATHHRMSVVKPGGVVRLHNIRMDLFTDGDKFSLR